MIHPVLASLCPLVAALALSGPGFAQGQPPSHPAPSAPAAAAPGPTTTSLWRAAVEQEKARFLATYRSGPSADPRWDDRITELFTRLALWSNSNWTEERPAAIAVQAKKLIDEGCTDAAVLYIFAITDDDWKLASGSIKAFQRAEAALAESRYPRYHLMYLRHRIAEHHAKWKHPEEAAKAVRSTIAAAIEAAREMKSEQVDPRLQYERLASHLGMFDEEAAGEIVRSIADDEQVDRWLALTLNGDWRVRAAWRARGSDVASKVTEEDWEEFFEHLAKARRAFSAAYEMAPDRPEPSAGMIRVVTGERGHRPNEVRLWFDRAVRAQFDFNQAYVNYLWSLRPRWGGSHEAILAFARECRDSRRYDTAVPSYFVQGLLSIADDEKDFVSVWTREPGAYEQARESLEKTSAAIERPYFKRWSSSMSAVIAWLNQRYADGFASVRDTGFRVDESAPSAVGGLAVAPVVRDLICLGGPAADLHRQAREAAEQGDFEKMASLCSRAVAENPDAARDVLAALRSREVAARQLADFHGGADASVMPKSDPVGWRVLGGSWSVALAGRAIEARIMRGEIPHAVFYPRFGQTFEIEGDIDFGPSTDDLTEAGILFGVDVYRARPAWYSVRLAPTGRVRIGPGTSVNSAKTIDPAPDTKGPFHFKVTAREGSVAITLNGREVYDGEVPRFAGPDPTAGWLGLWAAPPLRSAITFSNVVVRKAEAAKPGP